MRKSASGRGTNPSKPTQHPFHEIPNPQVLDEAKEFREGFLLMIQQSPGSGALLPALHCASIALELYLKSLSGHEIEVPDTISAGDVYIYAQSPAKFHTLADLFEQVPTNIQQLIEKEKASSRLFR